MMHIERERSMSVFMHENIESAMTREKQIKGWKRQWKRELIEKNNPDWMDLWPALLGDTPSLDPGFRRDDAT